ncbi:MAG: electron transport complex subunit RsxG [Candidatus Methylopumilus sp.]
MKQTILKHAVKTAWVMVAFTVVSTLGLAIVHHTTKAPISKAEAAVRMSLFGQILPTDLYDNDLLQDAIKQPAGGDLGNRDATMIHRARLKSAPAAVILEATAPDGYSGDIKLLVAIKATGEIVGVRVLDHKETPGLGDYIDIAHSDWIKNFDAQSLAKTKDDAWLVKKDGGQFDFTTGATITPRAVIKQVHKVLKFYQAHQQAIFATASGQALAQ